MSTCSLPNINLEMDTPLCPPAISECDVITENKVFLNSASIFD